MRVSRRFIFLMTLLSAGRVVAMTPDHVGHARAPHGGTHEPEPEEREGGGESVSCS